MSPSSPEPSDPPPTRISIAEFERMVAEAGSYVAELEARLAKKPVPAELRRRLLETARELDDLKAARDSWTKTALALELAEVKKPGTAEPSTSADGADCSEG